MRRIYFVLVMGAATAAATPALADRCSRTFDQLRGDFSAGEPGTYDRPARVVQVVMREVEGRMTPFPKQIEVRKGEQIKFVVRNAGALDHEFILATRSENKVHAADMRQYPDMEHADPNMIKVAKGKSGELIWRFTKSGEFEFGCLSPGHYEAGMFGKIRVK